MDHIKDFTADLIAGLNTDATLYVLAACLNQLDARAEKGAEVNLRDLSVEAEHAEVRKADDGWRVVYWAEGSGEIAMEDYGPSGIPQGFAIQPLPVGWPPRDGDTWADRDGREWLASGQDFGDARRYGFRSDNQSATVDRLVEMSGPLRLVSAGWERLAGTSKAEVSP